MVQHDIKLSVINDKLDIDPIDPQVDKDDIVVFFTNDSNIVFEVNIDNSDGFFLNPNRTIIDEVWSTKPIKYIVNDPTREDGIEFPRSYSVKIIKTITPSPGKVAPKIILKP
jgi:hypothetical protein